MKKIVTRVFVCFMGLMVIANIVCRIKDSYMIPKVVVGRTTKGALTHVYESNGIFTSSEHTYIQPQCNWKIEKILVQEGQMLEEGMPLWKYELEQLQELLQEKQEALQKYQIQVKRENMAGTYYVGVSEEERALQELEQAMSQVVCEQQWLLEEVEKYEKKIKEIDEKYEKKEALAKQNYNISRMDELTDTEKALLDTALQVELNELKEAKKQEKETACQEIIGQNESLFQAIQEMDSQELGYQNAMREADAQKQQEQQEKLGHELNIEELQIDIIKLTREIEQLQEMIEAEGYVYATENGMVSKIELEEGHISSGTEKLILEKAVDRFQFELSKDEVGQLAVGDVCMITVEGKARDFQGMITCMKEEEDTVEITCEEAGDISWDGCRLNQQGLVKIKKKTEEYYACVPIHAILCKNGEYYCRVVTWQDTLLGKEQIVEEERVVIVDQDSAYAAITGNVHEESDIVLEYDKVLTRGDRVRVVREIQEGKEYNDTKTDYAQVKVKQAVQEEMITKNTRNFFTCFGEMENCSFAEKSFGREQQGSIVYVAGEMQNIKEWNVKSGTLELEGDEKSVIISSNLAMELYQSYDVIGQELVIDEDSYYVRGVVEEKENRVYLSAVTFSQEEQKYCFTKGMVKHNAELCWISMKQASLQQLQFQLEKNSYPEIDMIR